MSSKKHIILIFDYLHPVGLAFMLVIIPTHTPYLIILAYTSYTVILAQINGLFLSMTTKQL